MTTQTIDTSASEPTLVAQLQSLLGKALGSADDPEQATRIMLEALQVRAELPKLQRRVTELETALASERAKLPPLEAELEQSRRFEMLFARETGKEGRDEIIGFASAAISTLRYVVPDLNQRCEALAQENADLKARYQPFEPVMTMISASLGRAGSFDEMYKVTGEALEARAEREANRVRMQEVERERALEKLDARIAKAKDERRLTPFAENGIRHGFANGTLTFEAIDFMLDTMPRLTALDQRREATPPVVISTAIRHNGKTWAELEPRERAELKRECPEVYADMRDQALGRG